MVPAQDKRAELSSLQITAGLCGLPGWAPHAPLFPLCLGIHVSPAPWHAGPWGALCKERDEEALRESSMKDVSVTEISFSNLGPEG